VLSKILLGEVPSPSSVMVGLPPSLDRAVLRGLERDPTQRYASAREMAAHIEACIGVAPPGEIAAWLERTAGDELRQRAAHIQAIERAGDAKVPVPEGIAVAFAPDEAITVTGKATGAGLPPVKIGLFLRALDNEYQHLQREECLRIAARCGFTVRELVAHDDAEAQRRQIEECLKEPHPLRLTVLLVNPVDEVSLNVAARLAAQAGIGWVSLNRDFECLEELRMDFPELLFFSVSPDQRHIGRIQGRHLRIMLPGGGRVLYVQGPATTSSARLRLQGTQDVLAATDIQLCVESSDWTVEGGAQAARRWLARGGEVSGAPLVVCAQNDGLAIGARTALLDATRPTRRGRPPAVAAIGCDGTPSYGRRLVEEQSLTATVVIPPTTGRAVEEVAAAREGRSAALTGITVSVTSLPQVSALERQIRQQSIE
jgi:ABC-type sugar transport system substrate-binding protein